MYMYCWKHYNIKASTSMSLSIIGMDYWTELFFLYILDKFQRLLIIERSLHF